MALNLGLSSFDMGPALSIVRDLSGTAADFFEDQ
jgi:hypothetical protein